MIVNYATTVIQCYPWNGSKDFYYRVELGLKNRIEFVYKKSVREHKTLDDFEIGRLIDGLSRLEFPILVASPDDSLKIIPVVQTLLQIKNQFCNLRVVWTNSDSANGSLVYEQLDKFVKEVTSLLPIKTEGLDLPIYY